jgi:hypothetical protein
MRLKPLAPKHVLFPQFAKSANAVLTEFQAVGRYQRKQKKLQHMDFPSSPEEA